MVKFLGFLLLLGSMSLFESVSAEEMSREQLSKTQLLIPILVTEILAKQANSIDTLRSQEQKESAIDQANNAYGRNVANQMKASGASFGDIETRIFGDAISSKTVHKTGIIGN